VKKIRSLVLALLAVLGTVPVRALPFNNPVDTPIFVAFIAELPDLRLNRTRGAFFYAKPWVEGDSDGQGIPRLREDLAAMLGTWNPHAHADQITAVGERVRAYVREGKMVDVAAMDFQSESVYLAEAKGPDNLGNSLDQFQNSLYRLNDDFDLRLAADGQALVLSTTIEVQTGFGVARNPNGLCILTRWNGAAYQPVTVNGQNVIVFFSRVEPSNNNPVSLHYSNRCSGDNTYVMNGNNHDVFSGN
jgi:hypothetical protein